MNQLTKTFWTELADNPVLMVGLTEKADHRIPMTAQLDPEANSCFWFYTTVSNRLAEGGKAMAQFASKGHDVFACIKGNLAEETDPSVIDKYWSKPVEAWYPEGRGDPTLIMLRFDLDDAEIWHADPDLKGIFKMLTGRSVDPQETGEHDRVKL